MQKTVDVAIVGSGTSGLNALSQVKKAGKSFVMINGGHFGTTCARVGCMPSKAFIQVAEDFHRRELYERHGIEGGESISLDSVEAMEHVRDMRDIFVDRVCANSTDNMPEEVLIEGYAEFIDTQTLKVNDITINANAIVLATGTRPIVPEAWKAFGDRILTSDEIFEQESLPASVAVIGLGVIGLELGQSLNRMGVKVTGIDAANSLAGLSDEAVAKSALEIKRKEFDIWLGAEAQLSEAADGRIKVQAGDHEVEVEKVLVAIGRRPNLDNIGLDKLDIPLDDKGMPVVNPNTLQVGDLPIFMAGDNTGHRPILHEAGDEGKIAGYNASHDEITAFRRKTPLAITFCDPNIISTGKPWSELKDRDDVVTGEMPIGPVGRALIMGKNKGLIRVYAEKRSGKLLGAAMACPKGENLAHLVCWAIEMNLSVHDMLRMPFYHPVMEEALQAALNNCKSKLDPETGYKIPELEELSA